MVIAAPHTRNWDLPYTLMVAFALRLNIHWLGKQSLFRWQFGPLMRWLGGIEVIRSQHSNQVAASAQALREAGPNCHLVVPPRAHAPRPGAGKLASITSPCKPRCPS